ncbi:hypothetical protein HYALB_00006525 [Hymenoscyphus albidus]|uniref:Uncharacterized protein n=1 Tax=Hymenoscyphus albidus TaxID=595503 RepID=A0A9N9LNV0_9HELO|nr:hypothetical protein HYALB_00006525 [Hymenoscyphus albidus]
MGNQSVSLVLLSHLIIYTLPCASARTAFPRRQLHFPNISTTDATLTSTISSTIDQTDHEITPAPQPNTEKFQYEGSMIYGEPEECFNPKFVNSLSRWIGNQTVPLPQNECWEKDNSTGTSCRKYHEVSVDVGPVQLYYFLPADLSNTTRASTYYDNSLDYTFTSPSVYMLWEAISAVQKCDQTSWSFRLHLGSSLSTHTFTDDDVRTIGPVLRNVIHAFDITEITTYKPSSSVQKHGTRPIYPISDNISHSTSATTSMLAQDTYLADMTFPTADKEIYSSVVPEFTSDPDAVLASAQLTLSDLFWNCPRYSADELFNMTSDVWLNYQRCNPYIVVPEIIKEFGKAWWTSGYIARASDGTPDPPHALQAAPANYLTPESPVPSLSMQPAKPVATANTPPVYTKRPYPVEPKSSLLLTNPVQLETIPLPNSAEHYPSDTTFGSDNPKQEHIPLPGNVEKYPGNGKMEATTDSEPGNNPASNAVRPSQIHESSKQRSIPTSGSSITASNTVPLPAQDKPISAISVTSISTDCVLAFPIANGGNNEGGFVIPGGSTIKAGDIAALPQEDNDEKTVVYSVNGAGNLIVSSIGAITASTIAPPDAVKEDSVIPPCRLQIR